MKKGFTLIELLAVIILLGALALITIVSVSDVITNSENKTKDIQISSVKEAARKYFLESDIFLEDNASTCVNISELINNGYFETDDVIDPITNKTLKGSITITRKTNQYYYEYDEISCKTE